MDLTLVLGSVSEGMILEQYTSILYQPPLFYGAAYRGNFYTGSKSSDFHSEDAVAPAAMTMKPGTNDGDDA
jgi:hypothetical protein